MFVSLRLEMQERDRATQVGCVAEHPAVVAADY
jgi:hypothetical protein